MDFLKELFAIRAQLKEEEDDTVQASDMKVDDQVHQQLDDAAEDDDLDAQCFGLEMEDGKVVKVYVKQEDAEKFEEAMSKQLGETDDIQAALDELEKDFEIIKVVWPDDDTEGAEDDDEETEDEDDDGSSSLNPDVNYDDDEEEDNPHAKEKVNMRQKNEESIPLTYGQAFSKKIMELKWSDEESKSYNDAASRDEDENDSEDEDANQEPSSPQAVTPKGIEADWEVEKDEDGAMTISNKRFKIELDPDETLELLNKIVDKQVARFKNEQGKIVYVFTPRGSEYTLKTPEFQGGFRIPKDIIKKMLD